MNARKFHAVMRDGSRFEHACSKLVCVGRNYAEHAKELNNPVPTQPILFIKPESSVQDGETLRLPRAGIHYELELAVVLARDLDGTSTFNARTDIAGLGLGIDLTDRDLQSELKQKGHPWERAKAFDGACYLTPFVPFTNQDLGHLSFTLDINGERRQHGHSCDMLFSIDALIDEITSAFTLRAGDVVLTGTPKGVGQLAHGDVLALDLLDSALSVESLRVVVDGE